MTSSISTAALLLVLVSATPATGQVLDLPGIGLQNTDREQDPLPAPEAIIDRFIEATGGREAYERIRNRRSEGTYAQGDGGMRGSFLSHQSRPNNRHVIISMPGGSRRFVTNAEESWTYDGDTVIASGGEQRTQEIRRARFDPIADWEAAYPLARTLGADVVDDRPVWIVRLLAEDCHKVVLHFDQESGLLLRSEEDIDYGGLTIRADSYLGGYRVFDGLRLPTRTRRVLHHQGGPTVQLFTIDTVSHDVAMDETMFETPFELRDESED